MEKKRSAIFKSLYGKDYDKGVFVYDKSDFYKRIYSIVSNDRALIQTPATIKGPFATRIKPMLEVSEAARTKKRLYGIFHVTSE